MRQAAPDMIGINTGPWRHFIPYQFVQ